MWKVIHDLKYGTMARDSFRPNVPIKLREHFSEEANTLGDLGHLVVLSHRGSIPRRACYRGAGSGVQSKTALFKAIEAQGRCCKSAPTPGISGNRTENHPVSCTQEAGDYHLLGEESALLTEEEGCDRYSWYFRILS